MKEPMHELYLEFPYNLRNEKGIYNFSYRYNGLQFFIEGSKDFHGDCIQSIGPGSIIARGYKFYSFTGNRS
jgi:hypothetical protein